MNRQALSDPSKTSKVTLSFQGRYFRATVASLSRMVKVAHKVGILEVGRHWRVSGFRALQCKGKLQEISKEQALRLLNMLPPAMGTKPSDYPPRKTRLKTSTVNLEKELLEQIKGLAKRRRTSAARLQREWIRLGLALELDREQQAKA